MTRNLQQEYLDLTLQLQDVTRRRNEVGELLAEQRRQETRTAASIAKKNLVSALIAVGDRGDWAAARQLTGVSDARLAELFLNALRHVRTANPDKRDQIPSRIGPRTLQTWKQWGPYVKKYLKSLP